MYYSKKHVCTLLLGVLFTLSSIAQINLWDNPSDGKQIKSAQWEVNDLLFRTKARIENPFEAQAFAIVKGEGQTQRIPLIYNGDNEWIFRYSSSTTGKKSYVLESEIRELDGRNGEIVITKNKRKGRHGGIVLREDNSRHFFHEDGSHYFNLAFECDWLFALDYGQEDVAKTKHLMSLLNKYGFNQVVMTVYSHDVSWPKYRCQKAFDKTGKHQGVGRPFRYHCGGNSFETNR